MYWKNNKLTQSNLAYSGVPIPLPSPISLFCLLTQLLTAYKKNNSPVIEYVETP